MSLYEQALDALAKSRGWGPAQCDMLRSYADQVAAVESDCNPTACQRGGGPGRGKYQFELMEGGSGANAVARTRMMNFCYRHGVHLKFTEADQKVLESDDPDFSQLSEDAQDAIFIANADRHPKMRLDDLVKGRLTFVDAWVRYHWAGGPEQEPARREHWRRVNTTAADTP